MDTTDFVKMLNNNSATKNSDEDCTKWSDMGKNTTQTPKTTPVEYIDKLREKIWRRSHSQKSVNTYNDAIKSFEKFQAEKNVNYGICMENPIETRDSYASWLDAKH